MAASSEALAIHWLRSGASACSVPSNRASIPREAPCICAEQRPPVVLLVLVAMALALVLVLVLPALAVVLVLLALVLVLVLLTMAPLPVASLELRLDCTIVVLPSPVRSQHPTLPALANSLVVTLARLSLLRGRVSADAALAALAQRMSSYHHSNMVLMMLVPKRRQGRSKHLPKPQSPGTPASEQHSERHAGAKSVLLRRAAPPMGAATAQPLSTRLFLPAAGCPVQAQADQAHCGELAPRMRKQHVS